MAEGQDEDYEYLSRHGVGEMLEKALGELVRQRPADAKVWLACYLAGDLDASSLLSKNMILENNVADLEAEIRDLRGDAHPKETSVTPSTQTQNIPETEWLMPLGTKSFFPLMVSEMASTENWDKVYDKEEGERMKTRSGGDTNDMLIVMGMQGDYLPFDGVNNPGGGRREVPESEHCAQVISALIENINLHRPTTAVVVMREIHPMDHCTFTSQGGFETAHCVAGSKGSKLDPDVGRALAASIDRRGKEEGMESCSGVCFRRFHARDCSESAVQSKFRVPSVAAKASRSKGLGAKEVLTKHSYWLEPYENKIVRIVPLMMQQSAYGYGNGPERIGVQWGPDMTWPLEDDYEDGQSKGLSLLLMDQPELAEDGRTTQPKRLPIVEATPTAIRFKDDDVWIRLTVVHVSGAHEALTEEVPEPFSGADSLNGDYHILPGELVNDMPVWMKCGDGSGKNVKQAPRWLYSGGLKSDERADQNLWCITDDRDDIERGNKLIQSEPHHGLMPWEMKTWEMSDGTSHRNVSNQVKVTQRDEDAATQVWSGGFFLQSAGLQHWDGTTDVNAPPDATALLPEEVPESLLTKIKEHCWSGSVPGNVYLCGVPLDTAVLRTAEAIASHLPPPEPGQLYGNVRILLDASRASMDAGFPPAFSRPRKAVVDRMHKAGIKVLTTTALMERNEAGRLRQGLAQSTDTKSDAGSLVAPKFPHGMIGFQLRQVHAIRRHMKLLFEPTEEKDGQIDLRDIPLFKYLWDDWDISSKATLSPIAKIPTHAPNKRIRYQIPLDAETVCFAYPVAGFAERMAGGQIKRCSNDPEFQFPANGGFVYLRKPHGGGPMEVLGCRAIMIPGTDMTFERPRKWPPQLQSQVKKQDRFQKVTLQALAQADSFVWIKPGDELEHAAHGAFGYIFPDRQRDHNCIFTVVDPDYN